MDLKYRVSEYLRKHWIRLLGAVIYGFLIVLAYWSFNKDLSWTIIWCDATFIGGGTLVFFGLLVIVTNLGGLDIFSFMFNRRRIEGRKEDFYEYGERKKVERKSRTFDFVDYVAVGLIYIIVSVIILIA